MNIDFEQIPNELMHEVLFVREICQATLLDREKRKSMGLPNGSPDTLLVSLMGSKKLVRRDEILSNYKNTDGSAIRLSSWHYDKKYIVYRDECTPMRMFVVPNNSNISIEYKGNKIKNGACIIKSNDKKVYIISQNNFRKQFKVTKVATKSDIRKLANSLKVTKELERRAKEQQNKWRPTNKKPLNENAIGLITGALVNRNGAIIGYRVKNIKTNKLIDLSINKVKELCRNQKIKNMTIVAKDGKEFLRGIGIRKENLERIVYTGMKQGNNESEVRK